MSFVIDVAHGAQMSVVEQTRALREIVKGNAGIIVGNFATSEAMEDFISHTGKIVDAFKIGIGGGSACLTRVVTGCGLPTLGSILDCSRLRYPLIADGGMRNSGDICKALAAGATAVMLGRMLAGTDESSAEAITEQVSDGYLTHSYYFNSNSIFSAMPTEYQQGTSAPVPRYRTVTLAKKYRGSASAESYEAQGKTASWRAPEGDSFEVPYVGSVKDVLEKVEGGLRSCMTYLGASNINELQMNAEFVRITHAGNIESGAHGKRA